MTEEEPIAAQRLSRLAEILASYEQLFSCVLPWDTLIVLRRTYCPRVQRYLVSEMDIDSPGSSPA
jgi:hypothetical protein